MKVSPLIRTLFPVAMISVAAALPCRAGMLANALANSSFETQNPQLATNGKVQTGFATLTSWANTGTPPGTGENSGIQGSGNTTTEPAESGSFFIFEDGSNPGAFQITGTTLNAGDQLTLTWYAENSYGTPVQAVSLLSASSMSSAFTSATTLTTASGSAYALGARLGGYQEYTLTYTATAANAGQYVGVEIANTAAAGSFLNTDNYDLAITSVPEPGTSCVVVMGAGVALLVIRRRKQALSKRLCA